MLSERVRSGSEAAPWVVDEIKQLEDEIERLRKEIELLHIRIDYYMKVLALLQQKDTER